MKIVRLYVKGTGLYGFTRAVTWEYEGKKEYYNAKTYEFEVKNKLFVDKACDVVGKTVPRAPRTFI